MFYRSFLETMVGILAGTLTGFMLGYMLYLGSLKIDLRKFFYITSTLLVLVAGGILGYGIHELLEYLEENNYELGVFSTYIYRLEINEDYILHEKNLLGSILAVLVGYTTKMEVLRALLQLPYQLIGSVILWRIYSKKD